MKLATTEAALVQDIRAVAEAMGVFLAEVCQRGGRHSGTTLGFPDLIATKKSGAIMLLEVKMPGERLTHDEFDWHGRFPGPVYVVHSAEEALEVMS
jgi:hypothetical protein